MTQNFLKIFACCSVAAVALSCAKTAEPYEPEVRTEQCVLQGEDLKVAITDEATGTVAWSAGDCLSVFSLTASNPSNNKFTQTGGSVSSFGGEIERLSTSLVALYPYDAAASIADGVISTSIPAEQTATAGSFCAGSTLCIATAGKTPGTPSVGKVTFSQLCAVLRVTIPSNITYANKITVTSKSGTAMAGNVTIDSATKTITSVSGTSSIVLSGAFEGGKNYYFAVAPGTYTNGFTFKIETAGGASFTRETTKTVEAAAGSIYTLGTLSLALVDNDVKTTLTITHNITNGTLNGSTAMLTLNAGSEFASTVKSWTVVLKNGSTTYRTVTFSGNASTEEMTTVNNWDYIPKGNYTYEISYVVYNDSKDVTRTLTARSTTSPQLSGVTLGMNLTGYSSYDTYKSSGASAANALDGSTIYNIGASYKSGLNLKDISKYASLLSSSTTLDGTAKTGDATGQSWAAHTIKGTVTFDGVSSTATKTVNVTGLPYNKNNQSAYTYKDDWSWTSHGSWVDDNYLNWWKATVNFKGFYIPANINATVQYRFKNYSGWTKSGLTCVAGTTTFINDTHYVFSGWKEYESTASVAFSPSAKSMAFTNTSSNKAECGATVTVQMFYLGVIYR